MNILIVGTEQNQRDDRHMDDKGWAFGLALKKLGHGVDTFAYKRKGRLAFIEKDKRLRKYWLQYMNGALLSHVKTTRPDLMLIVKGDTITPETLREIRLSTPTVIVNVFTDNPILMGNFDAIEPCHHFFVKDTYVVETLQKAGLRNVRYLPQCTNHEVHRPMELSPADREEFGAGLALIGSMYPYRHRLIEGLLEFSPALWGRGWGKSANAAVAGLWRGRDIRGIAKAKAISASSISLNVHHPFNDIRGTNSRTFDVAACAGFQLADYKPDIEPMMKIGAEIVCFRTFDELVDLIRYYSGRPEERAKIALAAQARVLSDHTYDNRSRELLACIGAA